MLRSRYVRPAVEALDVRAVPSAIGIGGLTPERFAMCVTEFRAAMDEAVANFSTGSDLADDFQAAVADFRDCLEGPEEPPAEV